VSEGIGHLDVVTVLGWITKCLCISFCYSFLSLFSFAVEVANDRGR
jgi:hypothetical protein